MKVELIGDVQSILSNPFHVRKYFGWPTVARLKNGRIAVSASGYRLSHICPFGEAVMSFSEDDGKTFTQPAVVINTSLDDRDAGLCPFGEKGLVFTSFNNTVQFQRGNLSPMPEVNRAFANAYLDTVTKEEEERDLGVTFRVSFDNGVTFGPIYHSPVTSPHGPIELQNGTILWVGRVFSEDDSFSEERDLVCAYSVNVHTGEMQYLSAIEPIYIEGERVLSCEPYAIQLEDGTLICHIRVQGKVKEKSIFTTYQSKSFDNGLTWTKPKQILADCGGAPSHLFVHRSGVLVATYGYRKEPDYSIRAMFSKDQGETWETDHILYLNLDTPDLGYPASVELEDGSILTVFYAHPSGKEHAEIMKQIWKLQE